MIPQPVPSALTETGLPAAFVSVVWLMSVFQSLLAFVPRINPKITVMLIGIIEIANGRADLHFP
ncbi:hypothetical protein COCMIDRAFT_110660 [Bipolaris oryzae ATCC 44560]|uniref:Uncharacterized protein n=1 Tax=Bipolaris oryzae ATCC 44560 TaxID=930090 RepID=W6Z7V5_COCMI|nr:uncharacterized protein COCMIDRAFT_110660 [Bipolaris oryzae ATCC 44560]EUC39761.1 hypothetical protein COCMIDRAFT_110660 [Bipolaris oryzae ATCC 44560]